MYSSPFKEYEVDPKAIEYLVDISFNLTLYGIVYGKVGFSGVFSLTDPGSSAVFFHAGGDIGFAPGPSFSIGMVDGYKEAGDYTDGFIDMGLAYFLGVDYCSGLEKNSVRAYLVTIGTGAYIGYDYYWTIYD